MFCFVISASQQVKTDSTTKLLAPQRLGGGGGIGGEAGGWGGEGVSVALKNTGWLIKTPSNRLTINTFLEFTVLLPPYCAQLPGTQTHEGWPQHQPQFH